LQRLGRVKADGALLIKWLPAIPHIAPADPRLIPLYQKLVELDLSLLVAADMLRFGLCGLSGPAHGLVQKPCSKELTS
jgi:hypothetical protein